MAMGMLRELNMVSILVRVVLSFLIGGMLGIERGIKNRPAGFRTHILVCLGAATVMMTNQYVFQFMGNTDPVRMGAQVISGIGFLGAGTIMITGKHQITGITTAAGLWTTACCGLAIGVGFYEGAILGGLLILIVVAALEKMDSKIRSRSNTLELYIEYSGREPFSTFLKFARENQLDIVDLQMNNNKYVKDAGLSVTLTVKSRIKREHPAILELIESVEGVQYIEEL